MPHRLAAAAILCLAPLAAQAGPRLVNITDTPLTVTVRCADGARVVTLAPRAPLVVTCAMPDPSRLVTLTMRDTANAAIVRHGLADDVTYWLDYDRSGALNIRQAGHDFETDTTARAVASR